MTLLLHLPQVLAGGELPAAGDGQFYPPTVIAGVTPDMRIWQEEVFGPVLAGARAACCPDTRPLRLLLPLLRVPPPPAGENGPTRSSRSPFFVAPPQALPLTLPTLPCPAHAVVKFGTDAEAVAIANDCPFGLGSSVFSSNRARACRIGSQLEVRCAVVFAVRCFGGLCPVGSLRGGSACRL